MGGMIDSFSFLDQRRLAIPFRSRSMNFGLFALASTNSTTSTRSLRKLTAHSNAGSSRMLAGTRFARQSRPIPSDCMPDRRSGTLGSITKAAILV